MRKIVPFLFVAALTGCGEPAADPKVESARVESAQSMRSLYDKVGGDYSKLTSADHDTYVKMFNGKEEDAKRMWGMMAQGGMGGGSTGSR